MLSRRFAPATSPLFTLTPVPCRARAATSLLRIAASVVPVISFTVTDAPTPAAVRPMPAAPASTELRSSASASTATSLRASITAPFSISARVSELIRFTATEPPTPTLTPAPTPTDAVLMVASESALMTTPATSRPSAVFLPDTRASVTLPMSFTATAAPNPADRPSPTPPASDSMSEVSVAVTVTSASAAATSESTISAVVRVWSLKLVDAEPAPPKVDARPPATDADLMVDVLVAVSDSVSTVSPVWSSTRESSSAARVVLPISL